MDQPQLTGRSLPLAFTFTSIKHYILLICPAHLIKPMDTLWTVTTLGVSYSITQFSSLFRASDTLWWKKVLENEVYLSKLCIFVFESLLYKFEKIYLYRTNCIFQNYQGMVTINQSNDQSLFEKIITTKSLFTMKMWKYGK